MGGDLASQDTEQPMNKDRSGLDTDFTESAVNRNCLQVKQFKKILF